jgi:hypothetical protein
MRMCNCTYWTYKYETNQEEEEEEEERPKYVDKTHKRKPTL